MEDFVETKKRGRGRPKGSKSTKPRKPTVRKAFSYSKKQALYAKYILRKDKITGAKRLKEAAKRMEYLRHSTPVIPVERMQKLEDAYLEMCSEYQEVLKTEPSRILHTFVRKKSKERKNVQVLSEIDKNKPTSIKNITFRSIDIADNRKVKFLGSKTARRWEVVSSNVETCDDFLHCVGFTGRQRLEIRSAYEAWMIRSVRPDLDTVPLLKTLLRLYATYYKNKYDKGEDDVCNIFAPEDFSIINGASGKTLERTKDFYVLLRDLKPRRIFLKAQYGLNRIIDMEDWNYTFDFLYGYKGNTLPLTCIYHGETNAIRIDKPIECPHCCIEKNKSFARMIGEQKDKALHVLDNEKNTFIDKAKEVHGDKYDYSLVEFVNWNRSVKIRCKKHDFVFEMSPMDHIGGRGCKKCAQNQKKTNKEFIEELRSVYGDSMDYSLVRYVNSKTNVVCVCKKHNEPVIRRPLNLLKGWGCSLCMKELGKTWTDVIASKYDKSKRVYALTKEQFIQQAQKAHGDSYDYSQVKYFNNDTAVIIQCKKCGLEFPVIPSTHVRGGGKCKNCYGKKIDHSENIRAQVFIARANEVHNNRYVYLDKVVYPDEKVHIQCSVHGEFTMLPKHHLAGFGCPMCFPNQDVPSGISNGEKVVMEYLDSIGVEYVYNKEVPNKHHLSNRSYLRPDFQLLDKNVIIEFNGEQHYRFVKGMHATEEQFKQQQLRDEDMRMYCRDNNIRLLEIRYDEIDKIPNLISNFLPK